MKNIAFSIVALAVSAGSASSATWNIMFEGEIGTITEYQGTISTETRGTYDFASGAFHVGQSFSGSITIEDSAEPGSTLRDDPTKDIYSSVVGLDLLVGAHRYSMGTSYTSYAQVWNAGEPSYWDAFSAGGNTYDRTLDLGPGDDLSSFTLHLFDQTASIFDETDLRSALSLLSGYGETAYAPFHSASISLLHMSERGGELDKYLFWDGGLTRLSFKEVSEPAPVPLPASLPLLAGGLGGLIAVRRLRPRR